MKTILIALSFPLVFLVSYQLSKAKTDPLGGKPPSEQVETTKNSPTSEKSAQFIPYQQTRQNRFRNAWDSLPKKDLSPKERRAVQMSLLQEWAAVDLEAALEAILSEPWGGQASNDWSSQLLRSLELEMWTQSDSIVQLLENNRFGPLENSKLEDAWIKALSIQEPDKLAAILPTLKDESFLKALGRLNHNLEEHLPAVWQQIKERKNLSPKALFQLMDRKDPFTDDPVPHLAEHLTKEELLSSYSSDNPNLNAIVNGLLAKQKREYPFNSIQEIPENQRSPYALQVLRAAKTAALAKDAVEQMIANEGWEEIANSATSKRIESFAKSSDSAEMAAWVANLPQREEARELFQLGIRPYLRQQPEAAWAWLEKFERGLWRDRGFGQISQHALYRQGDPELSQRALDMINDPTFKQEAEDWRSEWKERQGN
ncbi:MAG: hypothetical protein ACSHYB_12275 [Roseibacillus sp.]